MLRYVHRLALFVVCFVITFSSQFNGRWDEFAEEVINQIILYRSYKYIGWSRNSLPFTNRKIYDRTHNHQPDRVLKYITLVHTIISFM
jgi:hypothetical protein